MKNTWFVRWFIVTLIFIATLANGPEFASSDVKKAPALVAVSDAKEPLLPRAEQEKKANALFQEIFKLAQEEERTANLPGMIGLYQEIINKYPEAPLAQESYWRLIEIDLRDFSPPRNDKALGLFDEFRTKYPDSPLMKVVQGTMARAFYLAGNWRELLAVVNPASEEINAPKEFQQPLSIFYYSEAKFHLNDSGEAARGYQAIIKNFPDFQGTKTARERMIAIEKGP